MLRWCGAMRRTPEQIAHDTYTVERRAGRSKQAAAWRAHEESGLSFSRCRKANRLLAVFGSHERKLDFLQSVVQS